MATNTENAQTSSLQDFSFDDNTEFFGIKPEGNSEEKVVKEIKETTDGTPNQETTDVKEVKTKEEEKKAEKEPKFFNEKDEDDDDEEEDDKEDKEKGKEKGKEKEEKKEREDDDKGDDKFFTTLASEMKEKGILQNVELKEGETITEEQFFELQEKEIESRIDETFEAFFKEMDDEGKAFLKFKRDGGRTVDFLASYQNSLDIEELNEEDAEQVSQVLSHYLSAVEGLDAEELKDRLAWLKETGKEKAYAKKYFKAIEEDREEKQEAVVKAQEKAAKKKEEDTITFNKTLEKVISETEAVGEFTFTAEDKKKLGPYITKPSVKVGANKYVPAFQYKVAEIFRAETPEAQQRLLLLAKLVESDFDIKDVVTKKKTEVTKVIKSKLQDAKNNVKPATAGGYSKKSLGDFF